MNDIIKQLLENPVLTGISEQSYKMILPKLIEMELSEVYKLDENKTFSTIEGIQRQIDSFDNDIASGMIFIAKKVYGGDFILEKHNITLIKEKL